VIVPRTLGAIARASLLVLSALSAAACAPPPGAKVAAQVETVKAEQTPDKLLERGRAFANVGDFTRAEQYLAAALESGADPHKALPLLLKVCVEEKRYRVAIDYAEPVLKKRPNDHRLRFVVASLYAMIGESRIAREHMQLVVEGKPDYADVHYALAVLLKNDEGDLVTADYHFREYLRLKPLGPHAEEARGSLLKTVP
jgi:tetratricopeptide (TPR) repeat protein